MAKPIIIAHRGASGTCPENTLLAFRSALEAGAKWIELDTQLVENELVVFHDDGQNMPDLPVISKREGVPQIWQLGRCVGDGGLLDNTPSERGCGSMVERGLPKPEARVRFPSPAPF